MTFRIKFNTVNMDNISYHDNKLETGKTNGRNKGTCHKLHNIGSTENSEKNNYEIWEWLVIIFYVHD